MKNAVPYMWDVTVLVSLLRREGYGLHQGKSDSEPFTPEPFVSLPL